MYPIFVVPVPFFFKKQNVFKFRAVENTTGIFSFLASKKKWPPDPGKKKLGLASHRPASGD